MSLRDSAAEEFKRSPLTVSATVAGVVLAALALFIAWLQFAGRPQVSATSTPDALGPGSDMIVSNVLLILAFFLAATFSAASLTRMIARAHPFPALPLSVLVATLSIFGTLVVLSLAPPRQMTAAATAAANDAVFYGTVVIFIAINGLPVIREIAAPVSHPKPAPEGESKVETMPEGLGILGLIGLTLVVWCSLVGAGQSMLVRTFLSHQ